MTSALVLGGGGVSGIAWMIGLLAGLNDSGQDFTAADLTVGTSAGSTVAALLGSGSPLAELYARQVDPRLQAAEITAEIDLESFGTEMTEVVRDARSGAGMRRAVGEFALAAATVTESERRTAVRSRLASLKWPHRALKIVAVDAETGAPRVFENASGVSLLDAVTASCAVPGVWPPATIEGHRYIDGGVRSNANADLAVGAERVLVIVPLGDRELFPVDLPVTAAIDVLRNAGAEVAVVSPDAVSLAAIGVNPLDPSTRRPAAEAGRAQGRGLTLDWRRGRAAADQ